MPEASVCLPVTAQHVKDCYTKLVCHAARRRCLSGLVAVPVEGFGLFDR